MMITYYRMPTERLCRQESVNSLLSDGDIILYTIIILDP